MLISRACSGFFVLALLSACTFAPVARDAVPARMPVVVGQSFVQPEAATGYTPKAGKTSTTFMAVAAHPEASRAAHQMLRAGGSAVDAAIAAQMVLTLVEPQSSGIGGGAFLLHFDGRQMQAFDGRETAPAAVSEALFQTSSGKLMPIQDAVVGGRSVGVPGVLRMLELAHRQHGKLPWPDLFLPAIELAESGFIVTARLASLLAREQHLYEDRDAAGYFFNQRGQPWQAGHRLKNPELARVLRRIAAEGADGFYRGSLAIDIVAKVRGHKSNPGALAMEDMASYRPLIREPLCGDYKIWRICGMPPPSSGAISILQMLGMLERHGLERYPPQQGIPAIEAVHLMSEAGRLAFADRNRYVADPAFAPLPGGSAAALLNQGYLAARAGLITQQSIGVAASGDPAAYLSLQSGIEQQRGLDQSPGTISTSHVSIVDGFGNAVSMTSSIERAFGSRLMVGGFMLNNQLTDFSFASNDIDGPIANRVQPGKRPRSAMAPTLILDRASGQLRMVIGSPGGPGIINYVFKVIVGALDWKMDIQEAIDLPNFGSRNGPTELERGRFPDQTADALAAKGHRIVMEDQTSGLHGILRPLRDGGPLWSGGADPRREGIVMGE